MRILLQNRASVKWETLVGSGFRPEPSSGKAQRNRWQRDFREDFAFSLTAGKVTSSEGCVRSKVPSTGSFIQTPDYRRLFVTFARVDFRLDFLGAAFWVTLSGSCFTVPLFVCLIGDLSFDEKLGEFAPLGFALEWHKCGLRRS